MEPLARRLAADHQDWGVHAVVAEDATKPRLSDLVCGADSPALLFTAGHGVGWPAGHPEQLRRQGALVCQEWPGPHVAMELSRDAFLCAEDVSEDARPHGLLAFHFACFGAGTPEWDEFADREGDVAPGRLAPAPFVSALPRRLLAHPNGGALAVAGHVDRAWGYSFRWPGAGRQTEVYRSCLARLLRGHPIGSAFDYVNQRYAELSSDLSAALHDVEVGRRPDHVSLAAMWTANNDARGFVVLGDPAVRLPDRLPTGSSVGRDGLGRLSTRDELSVPPTVARARTGQAGDAGRSGSTTGDVVRDVRQRLAAAAEQLSTALERLTAEPAVLEVSIYGSEDTSTARSGTTAGGVPGGRLRARVRTGPAGELEVLVPEQDTGLDTGAWPLVAGAMTVASQERSELLRYLVASLTAVLGAMRDIRED